MTDYTTWVDVLWAEAPRDLLLLWTALALWVVLILLRPRSTLLLHRADGGSLAISRHALHRLLENCAEQLNGVSSARAEVTRRRANSFRTRLSLKVRPHAKLDAIQGYLEQEIGEIFQQNLGLRDAKCTVEIKVVGVTPDPKGF